MDSLFAGLEESALPRLYTPAPHPFGERATVRFELPRPSMVRLEMHDLAGRRVMVLGEGWYTTGSHAMAVDAETFPPGMYLLRLTAGQVAVDRVVLHIR